MVGVGGGLMAIIHLAIKRPIIGALGLVGIAAIEFSEYPVDDMISRSCYYAEHVVDDFSKNTSIFLTDKLKSGQQRHFFIRADAKERVFEKYGSQSGKSRIKKVAVEKPSAETQKVVSQPPAQFVK